MSRPTDNQARGAAWKSVVEHASRDFVDEQLQREPFCSVSLVEGKLHNLTNQLNGIERSLVRYPVLPRIHRVLAFTLSCYVRMLIPKRLHCSRRGYELKQTRRVVRLSRILSTGSFFSLCYRQKLIVSII